MNEHPRLKFIACHRTGLAMGEAITRRSQGQKITKGPLRGCWRAGRSIFKIGRGHVLEFAVVIRVEAA